MSADNDNDLRHIDPSRVEGFVNNHDKFAIVRFAYDARSIGGYCDACGQSRFHSPVDMYRCVYGCSRVTCIRCVIVGAPHFKTECEDNFYCQHQIQDLDHYQRSDFMQLMIRISRLSHVYYDLHDWYRKEYLNKRNTKKMT